MVYTPTGDPNINTLGAVALMDGESPLIFTAIACATVSGGQFVYCSGTNGAVVGSGANTYASSDLLVAPSIYGDQVNGLALYNVASGTNNYVAVARKGSFLVQASDVVSGGTPVVFNSGGVANIFAVGSGTTPGALQFLSIGRAMSCGDSGGYALVALNL